MWQVSSSNTLLGPKATPDLRPSDPLFSGVVYPGSFHTLSINIVCAHYSVTCQKAKPNLTQHGKVNNSSKK